MVVSNEMLMIIGSYAIAFIIPIIFLGSYMKWLPFKIMSVKSSGGKKILLRKRLPNGNQYFVGKMSDEDSVWNEKAGLLGKDSKGRVTIPHKAIHQEWGCKLVEFDSSGTLYCPDGTLITGFDAKHLQDLIDREAQKPAEDNGTEKLKLILAIGTFLALLFIGYLVFKNSQKSDLIIQGFNNLQNILVNSTVHTL